MDGMVMTGTVLFPDWLRCVLTAVLLAIVAGCATSPQQPGIGLQWPDPPAPPRIRWVKEIRTYGDAGISKGWWQRIVKAVTGEAEPGIGLPYGVMASPSGRLFVVDTIKATIHEMNTKDGLYTAIGGEKKVFRTPIAICEDDDGSAYISDSAAGKVYRYSLRDGTLTVFLKIPLQRPTGIAWNKTTGMIYVTDTAAHQVVIFDRQGRERSRIGIRGDGPGQFNFPTDLFIDKTGRLFVTDALNAKIQIFSPDGSFLRSFGQPGQQIGSFAKPKGVAVDSDGHIYVCDALQDNVQIFDDTGQLLLVVGSRGSGPGELLMPTGIHIDANDRIHVADALNKRVQVFQYLKEKP
jgi:DNA-binding beta-propeller fold protein YncE